MKVRISFDETKEKNKILKDIIEVSEWIYSKQGRKISSEVHGKEFIDLVYKNNPYFIERSK